MDLDLLVLQPPKGRTRWIWIPIYFRVLGGLLRPGADPSPRDDFERICDSSVFRFSQAVGGTDRGGLSADGAGSMFLAEHPHRLPISESPVYAKVLHSTTPAGAED